MCPEFTRYSPDIFIVFVLRRFHVSSTLHQPSLPRKTRFHEPGIAPSATLCGYHRNSPRRKAMSLKKLRFSISRRACSLQLSEQQLRIRRHGSASEALELGSRQIPGFRQTRQFLEFPDCHPGLLTESPIGCALVEPKALEPALNVPALVQVSPSRLRPGFARPTPRVACARLRPGPSQLLLPLGAPQTSMRLAASRRSLARTSRCRKSCRRPVRPRPRKRC